MKYLQHKLFNRDEVQDVNTNYLSWIKSMLTRLIETSNVAVKKIYFVRKEDCNIFELQTAK